MTAAQAVCHELEEHGIRCWMAPRDIPVGAKYASVITHAIRECKVVVLVFSEFSALSPWVESEVNLAFSNRKSIIPYKIDRSSLGDYEEFYLMLNNRHWIEAYPDYRTRFAELVSVVANFVGVVPRPAAAPLRPRTYAVGDYYNENGKEGIVFEVDTMGRHGKIMALWDLPEKLAWATREGYLDDRIGTADRENGLKNLHIIQQIPNWQQKYPAFAGCAALGEGWYLPARDELKEIYDNRKNLSKSAALYGGDYLLDEADEECISLLRAADESIKEDDDDYWYRIARAYAYASYWSSSEYGISYAWYVDFGSGNVHAGIDKDEIFRVRPVAAF